jgi:pimeloyl-ACP methyl ester carboxylesterase
MATYVLIHGAGSDSWYWHLVAPELRARGHAVVAPDLPCDDDSAGLSEYADVVVDSIGEPSDLVLVARRYGRAAGW